MNSEQFDFVIKDLHRRGILLDNLEDEIIDHVCSAVEAKMNEGQRFVEAYNEVIRSFGDTKGIQQTQNETATTMMFKSYLLVAFRNHLKQRFYTIINIGGLAIGVASCLIIGLFVINELRYDRHFPNADRLYRVDTEIKFGPNHFILATTSAGFGTALANDYPEIEKWARLMRAGSRFIQSSDGTETLKVSEVFWADPSLFKVFDVPMIEGDPTTAFDDINSIAISNDIAKKYFPGRSALGQSIKFQNQPTEYKITTVFNDFPVNTHLHPEVIMSMLGNPDGKSASLVGGGDFTTYLLLSPGVSKEVVESKLVDFVDRHVAPQIGAVVGNDFTIQKFRESGEKWDYTLMPLTDIHLRSDKLGELEANGSMSYVILLSSIGLLILGIACVNFINLSTAKSSGRAKEVGVRKVMGSMRTHLIRQFLVESTLLTFVAFALSLVVAWTLIPYFNELALQRLSIPFANPMFYVMFIGAALLIGVVAGVYPSFFLSAFKPIKVLKGQTSIGSRSGIVRSSLVVFQFMISIFLIIGTIVIQRQINFIQQRKLGFQKNQVLVIHDAFNLSGRTREYKDELMKNSFIQAGTISGYLPVAGAFSGRDTYWPEGADRGDINRMISLMSWKIDDDYITTLGMKVVTGRDFNHEIASDSDAIVVNQAAVRKLGFGDDALGKKVIQMVGANDDGTPNPNRIKEWTIIGVVEDFHYESMKESINPLAFFMRPNSGAVALRFDATHTDDVIAAAEKTWKSFAANKPFVYSFLDDDFAKMYSYEQRLGKIFMTFSVLAIIIACLGLFGLTAYTAEQRTKEIGIRKTLGASVPSIVILLSREFGLLVVIAYVIAAPLAWYATDKWLQGYTYKAEIGVFVYLIAGLSALIIAWLTMSYQSVRAALANPVKSLRSE
ncbi:MAG: ABC transporter permease [Bacteroidota bacterium]